MVPLLPPPLFLGAAIEKIKKTQPKPKKAEFEKFEQRQGATSCGQMTFC
jgi:hypothetical protein